MGPQLLGLWSRDVGSPVPSSPTCPGGGSVWGPPNTGTHPRAGGEQRGSPSSAGEGVVRQTSGVKKPPRVSPFGGGPSLCHPSAVVLPPPCAGGRCRTGASPPCPGGARRGAHGEGRTARLPGARCGAGGRRGGGAGSRSPSIDPGSVAGARGRPEPLKAPPRAAAPGAPPRGARRRCSPDGRSGALRAAAAAAAGSPQPLAGPEPSPDPDPPDPPTGRARLGSAERRQRERGAPCPALPGASRRR